MLLVWLAPWRASLKDPDENPESNIEDSFTLTVDATVDVTAVSVIDMAVTKRKQYKHAMSCLRMLTLIDC